MKEARPDWPQMATVGRVARVHGLRGQVVVNPETDFPESRFGPGSVMFRVAENGEIRALRVTSARFHRGRPIVGFEGIDSIEQAEALAGAELRVPTDWLEHLPADTYYVHDLVGCHVETRAGEPVGQVERVDAETGTARLAVKAGDEEMLVPLAADICVGIDVGARRIVIEAPEGLLELNRRRGPGSGIDDPDVRRRHGGRRPQRKPRE